MLKAVLLDQEANKSDQTHHSLNLAKYFVNFTNLTLVFKKNGCIEIWYLHISESQPAGTPETPEVARSGDCTFSFVNLQTASPSHSC